MTKKIIHMTLSSALFLVAGCDIYHTKQEMEGVFDTSVHAAVGNTLDELSQKGRLLGSRKPTSTKNLANGNIAYVYGQYWSQFGIDRVPCTVFLEVESSTKQVVNAYSKGDGCYRPY